jgi:hypothetical protein
MPGPAAPSGCRRPGVDGERIVCARHEHRAASLAWRKRGALRLVVLVTDCTLASSLTRRETAFYPERDGNTTPSSCYLFGMWTMRPLPRHECLSSSSAKARGFRMRIEAADAVVIDKGIPGRMSAQPACMILNQTCRRRYLLGT